MNYPYADPPPYDHQAHHFPLQRDAEYHGLFWEQRTAKSRMIIDTATYNYHRGRINSLLVMAPNGVHIQWAEREAPQWAPRTVDLGAVVWRAGRMDSKASKERLDALLSHDGLAMLAINWEALLTKPAQLYLKRFLRRKVLAAADESDDLGSPGAKRTRVAIRVGALSTMRRILTGTPAAEGPLKLYSQCNFLKWGLLGFTSFYAYKHRYAQWKPGYNGATGTEYEELVGYQNMEELNSKLLSFSSFVSRAECGGQLPKLAERRFVLGKEQHRAYDDLRDQFRIEMEAGDVTAAHVLARMTRLQQVTSGFVPLDRAPLDCPACDGTDDACPTCDGLGLVLPPARMADFGNPRLEALQAELVGHPTQVVIWTRFRHDADVVCGWLRGCGRTVARCDGAVGATERADQMHGFQEGAMQYMVASPQAAGRGVDFSAARRSIFYSHHWSLRLRLQAQDRIETLKRRDPVTHVNLVADGTVDVDITDAHAAKRNISAEITAHPERRWF